MAFIIRWSSQVVYINGKIFLFLGKIKILTPSFCIFSRLCICVEKSSPLCSSLNFIPFEYEHDVTAYFMFGKIKICEL